MITNKEGMMIGLVGNSGIGKTYVSMALRNKFDNLNPFPRVTTRVSRSTDTRDKVRTISLSEFELIKGGLLGLHHPFNNEIISGYPLAESKKGIEEGIIYIGDPDVRTLAEISRALESKTYFIGLIADRQYIETNLRQRLNLENLGGRITVAAEADLQARLAMLEPYNTLVIKAYETGIIQRLIEVNFGNRTTLVELVEDSLKRNKIL